MRRYLNLAPGEILIIQGREYEFKNMVAPENPGVDDPDDLLFADRRTGRPRPLSLKEFDRLYNLGEVRWACSRQHPADRPSEEDAVDTLIRRIRRHYLKLLDESGVSKSDRGLRPFIAEAATKFDLPHKKPSPTTLRRWARERGEPDDRRPLYMGDRFRHGPHAMRIEKAAQEVLDAKAEVFWNAKPPTQYIDVYHAVHAELSRRNAERTAQGLAPIKIPSATTIYRYLRRYSDAEHMRRRLGARTAKRQFEAIKGSLKVERILDKAIIDGTWLDCFVIDDELMIPVGRPYLMLMVDVKSRYPLAYVLSFVPESLETAMACLRQAVRPKDWISERYPDIKRRWVAYGVPRTILVDNAWAYTGMAFSDACADANISVEWAAVRTPEYKGIVERMFGTLNTQLIHKLPGGIPFKPHEMKQLGIEKRENDAVLTLSQINELITQYIVDVYGAAPHRALKMSPEQMWKKREPIDGIPYAKDLSALDRALGSVGREARITHKGVEFLGLTYCSPAVDDLLNDLLPHMSEWKARRGQATAKIKYHPEDLSAIYVWNQVRRDYVKLPCTEARYAKGLGQHHHKAIRAFAKAQQEAFASEEERCAARVQLRDKMLSFMPAAGLRTRRGDQRMLSPYGAKADKSVPNHGASPPDATGAGSHEVLISTTKNRRDGGEPPKSAPRGKGARRRPKVERERVETNAPIGAPQPKINPLDTFGFDIAKLLDDAKAE